MKTDSPTITDIRDRAVSSQSGANIRPKRGERGTGTTITIDLTDQPELLADIKKAAKADDREPSKWLRRRIVLLRDEILNSASDVRPSDGVAHGDKARP